MFAMGIVLAVFGLAVLLYVALMDASKVDFHVGLSDIEFSDAVQAPGFALRRLAWWLLAGGVSLLAGCMLLIGDLIVWLL